MANIKVSEMTEATSFDDSDYTMIVQANQNKKISKENMFSNLEDEISVNATDISTINTNIGDLTSLNTPDKTNIVNAINSLSSATIYNNASGTKSSFTLSDDISNYKIVLITFGREDGAFKTSSLINLESAGSNGIPLSFIDSDGSTFLIYALRLVLNGTNGTITNNVYRKSFAANTFSTATTPLMAIFNIIAYK